MGACDNSPPCPSPLISKNIDAEAWSGWEASRSSMPVRYGLALCHIDKGLMHYGPTTSARLLDVMSPGMSNEKKPCKVRG